MKLVIALLFFTLTVNAQEPAYCDPKIFLSLKKDIDASIWRDRAFRIGDTLVVGAAVGLSSSKSIVKFVERNSNANTSDKYCTWYFNESNDNAAEKFNHYYVTNPKKLTVTSGPAEYRAVLKNQFARSPTNFLSCLEKNKILVMGCNGQMHRGPTVFGMLLSFSGCSSIHAAKIVNTLWGLNNVKPEVRLAIIEEGRKLGDADPQARRRMQHAFGY